MKITINIYKRHRLKEVLKSKKFLILCNYPLLDNAQWLAVEQILKEKKCSFYRLDNSLTKVFLQKTAFYHLNSILSGNILIIETKTISNVDFIKKKFPIYVVKVLDKLYTFNQLSDVNSYNLAENTKYLNHNLNILSKKLSISLNKIKKS